MDLYVFYNQRKFEVDLDWITPDETDIREVCMDEWKMLTEDPEPTEEAWFEHVRYGSDDNYLKYFITDGDIKDFSELEDWVTSDSLHEGAKEAWLENMGGPEGGIANAVENYVGSFGTPRDFAQWYVDELIDLDGISGLITSNIDWDGVAADLLMDGYWEVNGYYFRNS